MKPTKSLAYCSLQFFSVALTVWVVLISVLMAMAFSDAPDHVTAVFVLDLSV